MENITPKVLVNFTAAQTIKLTEIFNSGQYADGYRYMRDIVTQERINYAGNFPPTLINIFGDQHAKDLIRLETWLSEVVGINAGDSSFFGEFVRGSTKFASWLQGKKITEDTFQAASDVLAKVVIEGAIKNGGVLSAADVVHMDVSQALNNLGLPPAGWAGVLGDVLPPPLGFGQDLVHFTDKPGLFPFLGGLTMALSSNLFGAIRVVSNILFNHGAEKTLVNSVDVFLKGFLSTSTDTKKINGFFFSEHLYGGAGNDYIYGKGGNDVIYGKDGDDFIDGGTGADKMYGGGNNDTYVVDNYGDKVFEDYGSGIDTVLASINYTLSKNVEQLVLTGSSNLNGTGNNLNNIITGNDGNNILKGEEGDDVLLGGGGNDTLYGGTGHDLLVGGLGVDHLWGGAGKDVFSFSMKEESAVKTPDWIHDFVSGEDKIDLSGFNKGQNKLTFVDYFTGKWGEILLTHSDSANITDLAINFGGAYNNNDFLVKIIGQGPMQTDFII